MQRVRTDRTLEGPDRLGAEREAFGALWSPGLTRDWGLGLFENEDSTVRPFLDSPATERYPRLSPDGRWVAFQTDASGRISIHVTSFPEPGAIHSPTSLPKIVDESKNAERSNRVHPPAPPAKPPILTRGVEKAS